MIHRCLSGEAFSPTATVKESYNMSANYYSHIFENAQMFPLEVLEFNNTLGKGAYGKVTIKFTIKFITGNENFY